MHFAYATVLVAALTGADDTALLEFSSANCPACRAVEPVVRRLAAEGYPIRQIDGDRRPDLLRQFDIRSYPTFVLVIKGREAGRIEEPASYEKLSELCRKIEPATAAKALPAANSLAATRRAAAASIVRGQSPDDRQPAATATGANLGNTALAATVRLKVEDSEGWGFGTGTIIDVHYNEEAKAYEALVVTCGHLFRESQGKGKITVDHFATGQATSVEGNLLDYDLERDIALVTIWPGRQVTPMQVAPKGFVARPQDRVFSVGCDRGKDPTVQASKVNAVNKYSGRPNITVAGMPVDGRSGGGLFSEQGLLICICNAADPQDNEGLFAGLETIQTQLDKFNLQDVYARAGGESVGATEVAAVTDTTAAPALEELVPSQPREQATTAAEIPELSPRMPLRNASAPSPTDLTAGELAPADDDTEVVVIVRSRKNPTQQSEVYVVDRAPGDLLARIAAAARQSAQARISASEQAANGAQIARQNRPAPQPVVRGQVR